MVEEKLKACSMCFSVTKYACIKCKRAVCNVCDVPKLDEDTDGWIYGKQVSYCFSCNGKSSLLRKRKLKERIIAGAVPSNEQRETETCISDESTATSNTYAGDTSLSTSSACRYMFISVYFIQYPVFLFDL